MAVGEFTLTIGSLSATLTEFTQYERRYPEDQSGQITYTPARTPVVDGPAQEGPLIWTIGLIADPDLYRKLYRIYKEQNRKRYTPPYTGYAVRVADEVELEQEFTATRLAINAPTTEDGYYIYYAYYDVWINTFNWTPNGVKYTVTLGLQELGKVSPP